MNVRVLFFGPLIDVTGARALDLTVADGSRVDALLELLFDRWPRLRELDASLLIAVNLSYARRDESIPPDSEVAIMPPVQGG